MANGPAIDDRGNDAKDDEDKPDLAQDAAHGEPVSVVLVAVARIRALAAEGGVLQVFLTSAFVFTIRAPHGLLPRGPRNGAFHGVRRLLETALAVPKKSIDHFSGTSFLPERREFITRHTAITNTTRFELSSLLTVKTLTGMTTDVYPRVPPRWLFTPSGIRRDEER